MPRTKLLVLCTDLDRTLLPNGDAPESAAARPLFAKLVTRPEVLLVYVSGRDKHLIQHAIDTFSLPQADFVIADVGSSIYQIDNSSWTLLPQWHALIAKDWHGKQSQQVCKEVGEIAGLELQAASKQGDYKLSYQVSPATHLATLVNKLEARLEKIKLRYNCIASIDETTNQGLIDILPKSANKRLAIDFLLKQTGITARQLVFSGDSGNDIDVLSSAYQATLVANASDEVKYLAQTQANALGFSDRLYLARGLSSTLNGNYAAGIIEGFVHYFPFVTDWLELEKHHG